MIARVLNAFGACVLLFFVQNITGQTLPIQVDVASDGQSHQVQVGSGGALNETLTDPTALGVSSETWQLPFGQTTNLSGAFGGGTLNSTAARQTISNGNDLTLGDMGNYTHQASSGDLGSSGKLGTGRTSTVNINYVSAAAFESSACSGSSTDSENWSDLGSPDWGAFSLVQGGTKGYAVGGSLGTDLEIEDAENGTYYFDDCTSDQTPQDNAQLNWIKLRALNGSSYSYTTLKGASGSQCNPSCNWSKSNIGSGLDGASVSSLQIGVSVASGSGPACVTECSTAHVDGVGTISFSARATTGRMDHGLSGPVSGTINSDVLIHSLAINFTGAPRDLEFWLVHVDSGKKIQVWNNNATYSNSTYTLELSDQSNVSVPNNSTALNNTTQYRPYDNQSMNSVFAGENADSDWKLVMQDVVSDDYSELDSWKLRFVAYGPANDVFVDESTLSRSIPSGYTYAERLYVDIAHDEISDISLELWETDGTEALATWAGSSLSTGGQWLTLPTAVGQTLGASTGAKLVIRDLEDVWHTGTLNEWKIDYTYILDGCEDEFRSTASRVVTALNADELSCDDADFLLGQTFGSNGSTSTTVRLPALTPTRDRHPGVLADGSLRPEGWWESYDRATDEAYGSAPSFLGDNALLDVFIATSGNSSSIGSNHLVRFDRMSGAPSAASLFVPSVEGASNVNVTFGTQWPSSSLGAGSEDDITLYLREQPTGTIGSGWAHDYARENYSGPTSADDPLTITSMLDYREVVPLGDITGTAAPQRVVQYVREGGSATTQTYVPRWHLGAIDFSEVMGTSHDLAGTQTDGVNGAVRPGAAVDLYYAPELHIRYDDSEDFTAGNIHFAFPITDPDATTSTIDGAAAFNDPEVDYWGIPNGVPAIAEFWVRITNRETNEIFDRQISSQNNPFVNKNCPFLVQDSLVMDISIADLGDGFGPGDQLDVSAVAFWATEGRRTLIWSENEEKDQIFLCAPPEPFSMDLPVQGTPTGGDNSTLDMTIAWDTPTGGRAYVEFLPEGEEIWQTLNPDGALRTQTTYVHTINLNEHRCDELAYRIRLELCDHTIYTETEALLINAEVENPWGAIPAGESIYADKGYQDDGVLVNWSVVQGNGASYSVDSYSVERRPYDPANQGAEDDWSEVYASGGELTYFDQEAASGILYEYRVSANIQCGVNNYLPYRSPTVIGYRSALAEITGEVSYGSGSPVDSVYITVQKMTGSDARLALKLRENNVLELPTADWNEQLTGGFNLSQWMRLDAFTLDHGGAQTPLLAWVIDNGAGADAEFISLRAEQTGDETFDLRLYQAGSPLPMNIPDAIDDFELGVYRHLAWDVIDVPGDDTLRLIVDGDLDNMVVVPLGNDFSDQIATTRAFRWGAAQSFRAGCYDPMAANFDPLATLLADCSYVEPQGCMNPEATNYDPTATQDIASCTFPSERYGRVMRLNWFSDNSAGTAAEEYPVIRNADSGEIVWSGNGAALAQGVSGLAWQPSTYRFPLAPGSYEIEVHASGSPVTGSTFAGNFDLFDNQGVEYINCTQFIPYGELNPDDVPVNPYVFEVASSAFSADVVDASASWSTELTSGNVIDDAADCFSWSFEGQSLTTSAISTTIEERSLEMWFNPDAAAVTGQKTLWSEGTSSAGLTVYLDDGWLKARATAGGSTAEVTARRVDETPNPSVLEGYNRVMPDQWHHFVLTYETGGSMKLQWRAEDWDESDGVMWNNLASATGPALSAAISTSGATQVGAGWHTGSTKFTGEIQRFSAFDRMVSDAEAMELFDGPVDGSDFVDGMVWASTARWNADVYNKVQISASPATMTSVGGTIEIVNRAPATACISGCNLAFFDASGTEVPANFNPFATNYTSTCNVASTGLIVGASDLVTGALTVDEIRIHRDAEVPEIEGTVNVIDATEFEASENWRYIAQDTPGLLVYLGCDEAVGNRCYDGARSFSNQQWMKNDARIVQYADGELIMADAAGGHFVQGEPAVLKNAAYTDQFGQYQIANIRYTGTGSNFKVQPTKGPPAHEFAPAQMNLTMGDGLRNVTDLNFLDISSFELDVHVYYQGRNTFEDYSDGTGVKDDNFLCPVPRVGFEIDGLTQYVDNDVLKTDHEGYARLTIPIGSHVIRPVREGHTFAQNGQLEILMVDDQLGVNGVHFVDVTNVQAVGKVVGGLDQMNRDWNTTQNNLGIAEFFVIPLDSVGGDPLGYCPAIPITTEATNGQFDVQLLPEVYRIGTLSDFARMNEASTSAHFTTDEANDFPLGNISISGWDYPTPMAGEWYDELDGESFLLRLETDPIPSQEILEMQQAQEALSKPEGSFRADLMYQAPPRITTWQVATESTAPNNLACPTSASTTALPDVIHPFIGAEQLAVTIDSKTYSYDLREHFSGYQDPNNNDFAQPFPFGAPVVRENTLYCMGVAVTEDYRMVLSDDPTTSDVDESYAFSDQMISSSPEFELTIYENLSIDTTMYVDMASQPVVVSIWPTAKSYSPGAPPLGTIDMTLTTDAGTVQWSPFDDYTEWAGSVALSESSNQLEEQFQAAILGSVVTAPGTPISTAAELDMILRDPPGDQSFASVSQGSEVTSVLSEANFSSSADFQGVNFKLAPTLRWTIGAGVLVGAFGSGIISDTETEFSVSPQFGIDHETEQRYDVDENLSYQETTTFNQSLSTTAEVDMGDEGNQDVYFGRTENVLLTVMQEFGLQSRLGLHLKYNATGEDARVLTSEENDVLFEASDGTELAMNLAWDQSMQYEVAPASYFAKTQYDIENNILPQLEALRNQYFEGHDELYNYPSAWSSQDDYPPGMYLANNDDPRWWLIHSNATSGAGFTAPAVLDFHNYSQAERYGPGYDFLASDLTLDSVRVYNNMILKWKLMLARNELDKLNARAILQADIANYDEVDELNNPLLEVLGGNGGAQTLVGSAGQNDSLYQALEDLWGAVSFEPYFLAFSGNSGEFTQTYTNTNTQSRAKSWVYSTSSYHEYFGGVLVNETGVIGRGGVRNDASQSLESEDQVSSNIEFSYTLSDDDQEDYYLVGVMPGRGADGPIFLNIGAGATSCPWNPGEEAQYEDYYLFFANDLDSRIAGTAPANCGRKLPTWKVNVSLGIDPIDGISPQESYEITGIKSESRANVLKDFYTSSFATDGDDIVVNVSVAAGDSIDDPVYHTIHPSLCATLFQAPGEPAPTQPVTIQVEQIELYVNSPNQKTALLSGPMDEPLVVNLLVDNQSFVQADADYHVRAIPNANTLGASVSIGGGSAQTFLPMVLPTENGEYVSIPATITANGLMEPEYLEGSIEFEIYSDCDQQIRDTITVEVVFEPACSDVVLSSPVSGWSSNVIQTWSNSQAFSYNDELTLRAEGLNLSLSNFIGSLNPATTEPAVEFQYRTSVDLEWKYLDGFTRSEIAELPSGLGVVQGVYDVDSLLGAIEDDEVRIRAVTRCSYGLSEVSDVAVGIVDRLQPEVFGDPLPLDRIYEPEDEFTIRFNEPMDESSFTSADIAMSGHFNGEKQWSAGVQMGPGQSILLPDGPSIMENSWRFSVQLWHEAYGDPLEGAIFAQGTPESTELRFGFNADGRLELRRSAVGTDPFVLTFFEDEAPQYPWTPQYWNTIDLALSYDHSEDGLRHYVAEINVEGVIDQGEIAIPAGPDHQLILGNSAEGDTPLSMAMTDFRFWQGNFDEDLASYPKSVVLTGGERGLAAWLPMTEMEGTPREAARDRQVIFNAGWTLPEGGGSLRPSDLATIPRVTSIPAEFAQSTTLEFWFRPDGTGQSILSTHELTENGPGTETIDDLSRSFEILDNGRLGVWHQNILLTGGPVLGSGWHHCAYVRDAENTTRLYLNGEEIASMPSAVTTTFLPAPLHIGARVVGTTGPTYNYEASYTGWVDEIRFWSSALEPEAIAARMHERLNTELPDLLFYAPFDSLAEVDLVVLASGGTAEIELAVENPTAFQRIGINADWSDEVWVGDVTNGIDMAESAMIPLETSMDVSLPEDIVAVFDNAANDEFIVAFEEDRMWQFEDQMIQIHLAEGVRDELGNPLASASTWAFIFDRHPLHMSSEEWTESILQGTEASYSFTLYNEGIDPEPWAIDGLPDWVEASPMSGIIAPLGSVDITLTLSDALMLGRHEADFRVTGDFCDTGSPATTADDWCYGERFHVSCNVEAEAPDWSFNPSEFNASMTVIAQVYNNGFASYDERDVVLAYVDGDLRGQAELSVSSGPQKLAFLTVFYDAEGGEEGEAVEFRIWDASNGVTWTGATACWPSPLDTVAITLNEEGWGEIFQPIQLHTTARVQQNIDLSPGWNWVSFNVLSEDLENIADAFADVPLEDLRVVKHHSEGVAIVEDGQWQPLSTLNSLSINENYLVRMASDDAEANWTMSIEGAIPDPVLDADTLHGGWNQLGYIGQRELPVEMALQSLWDADTVLTINDVIKSRYDGFAVYAGNGNWVGSLQWMTPGQGYKMKLQGAEMGDDAGVWVLPAAGMFAGLQDRATVPHADRWPMDVANLPDQQSLLCALALPSYVPQGSEDVLGVFADGECVGQAYPVTLQGQTRYFLSVFGDLPGTDLEFRLALGFNGAEYAADESMVFNPDLLTGTLDEPFTLHFGNAGLTPAAAFEDGSEAAAQSGDVPREGPALSAHPVPFTDVITVTWRGDQPLKHLRLLDARGQVIQLLDCPAMQADPTGPGYTTGEREPATCSWSLGGLSPGLYFLHGATEVEQVELKIQKQ